MCVTSLKSHLVCVSDLKSISSIEEYNIQVH